MVVERGLPAASTSPVVCCASRITTRYRPPCLGWKRKPGWRALGACTLNRGCRAGSESPMAAGAAWTPRCTAHSAPPTRGMSTPAPAAATSLMNCRLVTTARHPCIVLSCRHTEGTRANNDDETSAHDHPPIGHSFRLRRVALLASEAPGVSHASTGVAPEHIESPRRSGGADAADDLYGPEWR